jgi:hypothetical protein
MDYALWPVSVHNYILLFVRVAEKLKMENGLISWSTEENAIQKKARFKLEV